MHPGPVPAVNIQPDQLRRQYERALELWPFLHDIESAHNLPRFLLFAVGSRETNLRREFTEGATGDGGHGHGLFQLDDRWHVIPEGFDTDPQLQAETAAVKLDLDHRRFGDWISTLNFYNSGSPNSEDTTGGDYGPDVWARRKWLAENSVAAGGRVTDVVGGPVRPHVQAFANAAKRTIPVLGQIGTYVGHDPSPDRALDIFASRKAGDDLCDFAVEHFDEFGLWYVIWRQHIYNPSISRTWRVMADRGSITQNHYDHVHLSFQATGAATPEEDFLAALTPDEQRELLDLLRQERDRSGYTNAVLGELKNQLCEAAGTDNWHEVGKELRRQISGRQ